MAGARSEVYLFAEEAVSDMGVEVRAFGFGFQKFAIAVLGHVKVLVEEARVEFDFEQAPSG